MSHDPIPPLALLAAALIVLVPLGLYTRSLYNELATQWERLHSLLATARLMKARRHAVGRAVGRHVRQSARHVEDTTRRAAAGKRGGRHLKLNMDGYPGQNVVDLAGRGLNDDVQSCGLETDAQVALRREAADYNARLRTFPCCLIAPFLGFRPWKTHSRRPHGRRRISRRSNRRRR